jgi:hypothetical protein
VKYDGEVVTARRALLFSLVVCMFVSLGLVLGGELYLRRTQSYVVSQKESLIQRLGIIDQNPGLLVRTTPRGKRLIPGAKVIVKNHRLAGVDIPIEINSLGFRGKEIAPEKAPGVPRILMLGDSITWGDYLRDEDTYVRRTEVDLARALGHPVEVINGGEGDTGSEEQMDILEESGLRVKPDVVVLGFYLNDSRPPWGFSGEVGGRGWIRRHSLVADKFYEKLVLWRWIRQQGGSRFAWIEAQNRLDWKHDQRAFLELAHLADFDWGAAWDDASWHTIDEQLTRLENHARHDGFRVATLTFPVKFQVQATTADDSPQKTFAALSQKHGFPNLDLLPLFRTHASEDILFDQCHPTALMNGIIGAAVSDFHVEDVKRASGSPANKR